MPIEFDESQWPVVVCRAIGRSTDADIECYKGRLSHYLRSGEVHAVLIDARKGKSLASAHRAQIAAWNRAHAKELERLRAGLVLVTPSAFVRAMVAAIHWVYRPPFPYEVVDNMEEAYFRCWQQLHFAKQASKAG